MSSDDSHSLSTHPIDIINTKRKIVDPLDAITKKYTYLLNENITLKEMLRISIEKKKHEQTNWKPAYPTHTNSGNPLEK
jgi:hypothetical protein